VHRTRVVLVTTFVLVIIWLGSYLYLGSCGLLWRTLPQQWSRGDQFPVVWILLVHDWRLPFALGGFVIGLLVGWLPRRLAMLVGPAASAAALLLAIGLGHYVIGSRTLTSDVGGTWAEGPVWPQYALDVLAAAIGGFLGAAVLQLIVAWRKRTGKLAKTGIQ